MEWVVSLTDCLVTDGRYQLALQRADIYGQLLEATFDVNRHLLYQSLRWDLPEKVAEKKPQGAALTRYLWCGDDSHQRKSITDHQNDK